MNRDFPQTSASLISRLHHPDQGGPWQQSWRLFLELYKNPLRSMVARAYMKHTGGAIPSQEVIEDVVSSVIVDLLTRNGFSPERGRFRAYLAMLANARTVDTLRKDRPLDSRPLSETEESQLEAELVGDEFNRALLATMLTELREKIPHRWFAIFEQVKLKGRSPEDVAQELQVSRSVVDNTVFKAMQALRHIAKNQEYRDEYYEKP